MNTELKNLYESIIQDMIMEGITGMTPEIKELIHNAPVEKRRSMILTILEENNVEHRLLSNKIQNTLNVDNYSEMNHIKDVVGMLREYVKVSKTEVKEFGEVMTPITLVEEMLDTLPYEVWTNPNLKWLDPCNGVGTFFSVVIERLMKGLESFEPDEKLRYKHIVENMIYACELQPKNLFLYLYAFDPKDEYAMNVYCGSYLDEGFDKHMEFWGVEKFDVIVMNPPYNDASCSRGSGILWDKFVIKTISQLVEGGYLVAVHPPQWRIVKGRQTKIKDLLQTKQMLYIEIHNMTDGLKTFGVQTAYDFYCVHNVSNSMFTKIRCMDRTMQRIDISKMKFIPNGMFELFNKLVAKDGEEKVKIIYDSSKYDTRKNYMSDKLTTEHIYPIVNYTYKDGTIKFMYASINHNGYFNLPKVIWSCGGASTPIIDEKGEYGLTPWSCGIVDEIKNLPLIQKALSHPDFIKLMLNVDGIYQHRYKNHNIATFRKDFWKEFLK